MLQPQSQLVCLFICVSSPRCVCGFRELQVQVFVLRKKNMGVVHTEISKILQSFTALQHFRVAVHILRLESCCFQLSFKFVQVHFLQQYWYLCCLSMVSCAQLEKVQTMMWERACDEYVQIKLFACF